MPFPSTVRLLRGSRHAVAHPQTPRRSQVVLSSGGAFLALSCGLPAGAHHLIDINGLEPTPLHGLLSGLAHPVLGPDHLVFLLALCLLGLQRRSQWSVTLLLVGLAGSAAGLLLPGLPGAELLVAGTLAVEALVLVGMVPSVILVPAMALHGYVLSEAVLGWTSMPLLSYLSGLLLSQGLLLVASLVLLRRLADGLGPVARRSWALGLVGLSMALILAGRLA
jgi:urease accessory protein